MLYVGLVYKYNGVNIMSLIYGLGWEPFVRLITKKVQL